MDTPSIVTSDVQSIRHLYLQEAKSFIAALQEQDTAGDLREKGKRLEELDAYIGRRVASEHTMFL